MGGGSPAPASSFCGVCSKEMQGPWSARECTECGRTVCMFCVKKIGGFFGIGGRQVCPNCHRQLTKK